VGEMNATLTLSGGSFPTLPITIYRLIGSYQFHRASALGTVLIVLCAVAFLLLDRSTRRKKEM
jgi:thiamine transport system permease protein